MGAAQEAARNAAAHRARGRSRVPHLHRARRQRRARAARPYLYCDDRSVIGTEFFVMEYVPGASSGTRRCRSCTRAERSAIYRRDEPRAGRAAPRRLRGASASPTTASRATTSHARSSAGRNNTKRPRPTPLPDMDRLIEWLPRTSRATTRACLVHGDFRLDNMIFHPREPRVLAVLDWELSTLGHPLADLAYNCMPYQARSARAVRSREIAGDATGIPSEAAVRGRSTAGAPGRDGAPELALLSGVLVLPFGEHRAGRVSPRPARATPAAPAKPRDAGARGCRGRGRLAHRRTMRRIGGAELNWVRGARISRRSARNAEHRDAARRRMRVRVRRGSRHARARSCSARAPLRLIEAHRCARADPHRRQALKSVALDRRGVSRHDLLLVAGSIVARLEACHVEAERRGVLGAASLRQVVGRRTTNPPSLRFALEPRRTSTRAASRAWRWPGERITLAYEVDALAVRRDAA